MPTTPAEWVAQQQNLVFPAALTVTLPASSTDGSVPEISPSDRTDETPSAATPTDCGSQAESGRSPRERKRRCPALPPRVWHVAEHGPDRGAAAASLVCSPRHGAPVIPSHSHGIALSSDALFAARRVHWAPDDELRDVHIFKAESSDPDEGGL